MNYPKREPFFAHKFVRLLHKAAVAADIGRDAFSLLVVVAHTEDAMRYRGAAKFWNSQLIETLGFTKWDQFDKARRKAIESGWLSYAGDGKRTSGEYFVTIPDGYEQISDTPIEETCTPVNPENGYKQGYDDGYKQGIIDGIKRGQCGVQTGDKQGEPSIPVPLPTPSYSPGEEIQIPENLNTPEVMKVVGEWFQHLEHKGKHEKIPPRNSPQEQAWWRQAGRLGPEKFLAQAEKAMAEGWVSLRETTQAALQASSNSEWIRALNITRQYPEDWSRRQKELGDELFEAMKRTGTARVANAHGAELGTLEKLFNENLKDIRSGITTSN
jgi:hypothetical protein